MILPPNSIIASGPVIIENGKVLLNKEKKEHGSDLWMFPGGMVEDFDIPLEETCRREVMEEMGIDVKIIKPLQTRLVHRIGKEESIAVLVHFLAERIGEIKPGPQTLEWGWFDINNLPPDCAPNVYEVMKDFTNGREPR